MKIIYEYLWQRGRAQLSVVQRPAGKSRKHYVFIGHLIGAVKWTQRKDFYLNEKRLPSM